jgi:hypothetical protein
MVQSSRIQRLVIGMRTDVSEECITPIFRVGNEPNRKQECTLKIEAIYSSETSVHKRTTLSYVPEDGKAELKFGVTLQQ